ncbi:MAG: argininosuccinate lyase [Gemmatimonadales bacterium]|jgi:argininosuccinate lyase
MTGSAAGDDRGAMSAGLWGGRFAEPPAEALQRLNRSLAFDWHLWPYEIRVDRAWVDELERIGTLGPEDASLLRTGLDEVEARLADAGPAVADEPDEDVHSLIERWLEVEIGPVASNLRLGRSRNDVVATDTRLWARDAVGRADAAMAALLEAMLDTAERLMDVVIPAYSHLQQAQPTRTAHWLLSHFWPLARNRERLAQAAARMDRMPLGSAAGMGTTLPVDRDRLAEALGFEAPTENSLDGVGARDWTAELLYVWTQTAIDLTRLAEDLVIYTSKEFSLLRISDQFSTGSSLMPQKRNPDGAELARASGGVLLGTLTGFLATLKGLPTGYNKDLQDDKVALTSAERRLTDTLAVLAGTVATLEPGDGAGGGDPAALATDVADWLVEQGMTFKQAHDAAGALVRRAEELGVTAAELDEEARRGVAPQLGDLPPDIWDAEAAVEKRVASGGPARDSVADALGRARATLA